MLTLKEEFLVNVAEKEDQLDLTNDDDVLDEMRTIHQRREDRFQYQFKINLWSGIYDGKVIGPFELPENLNGANYLHFLQNDLPVLLEDLNLAQRVTMWYQNDGCPAHYDTRVRDHLNNIFPARWIGRLGPILWPPRSPDLNPLDFYYWGCLKEKVYEKPIQNVQQLRQRIFSAATEITRDTRITAVLKRSFIRRCRMCIRQSGGHFEYLL
ncbi:hypothetical protein EVAR_16801_1 [Eumeta japonica]|uniref:Transposable element Tc3 transposase n=1 Tax=Eumeta variegata TaxID=151549 RepID=A0A4C1ULT1_EUMVA|nr:hypothetical protein EVAR_16801_1 [Eumeta japonica]